MSKTFSLGGIHPHDCKISQDAIIETFPLPEIGYISMFQHLGAPADPVVEVGQEVKVGQLLAKASGFISAAIHSPYSGVIKSIEPIADLAGNKVKTIVIDVKGDEWEENIDRSETILGDIKLSATEIVAKIAESGVVGLGGATFPTNVKLSPPPNKKAEYLIINGAECEPFLTSDYRLMMEMSEQLLIGTRIMMKALNVNKAYIGIEENKPQAIAKLAEFKSVYPEIEVVSLKKRYPQGGEKQLIDAVIKRQVPSMGLPIDVGAVVQNVGTAVAAYDAVQKNKPLFESIVTITGYCLSQQRNFRLRVGVSVNHILESLGGIPTDCRKIISGGPMMGKAIANLDAPTLKGTSSLLLMRKTETIREEETNCIRCAKCVDVCPMGLEPYLLNKLGRLSRFENLENEYVYDCIECGCCSYTCPANIPLLDIIRISKASVLNIIRSRPKN